MWVKWEGRVCRCSGYSGRVKYVGAVGTVGG